MKEGAHNAVEDPATAAKPDLASRPRVIQRKCACGGSAGISGDCEDCQKNRLTLQQYSTERGTFPQLLNSLFLSTAPADGGHTPGGNGSGHNFGLIESHVPRRLQSKLAVSQPTDAAEQEADRVSEYVTGTTIPDEGSRPVYLSQREPHVQRQVDEPNNEPADASAPAGSESTSAGGLIVEDDVTTVEPGQMHKSEFLAELSSAIKVASEDILSTKGRTAEDCPYITNWIAYGYLRGGSYVETFIRRFAPGAEAVASAHDYIPLVTSRIRSALMVWAATGGITGVPADLAADLPDSKDMSVAENLGDRIAGGGGTEATANASMQAKSGEGGQARELDAQSVQMQLRAGAPLESGVKTRMEGAFGYDFSRVRVHNDPGAARLSTQLNARAFTIGSDVAFGVGEYRPGTPVGDAILAHELAHVVQQGGASTSAEPMHKGETKYGALEEDADNAAVGAVVSLWGGAKGKMNEISQQALPNLKSGLRLQRCESCSCNRTPEPEDAGTKDAGPSPIAPGPKGVSNADGKGWLSTNIDGVGTWALPWYLKVDHTSRTAGRDKFTVLEGKFKSKTGSVKQKSATTSYLESGMTYDSAGSVKFNKTTGKLDFGGTTGLSAITETGNPVPDGTHDLEIPDEPHPGGEHYESDANFAKTWFRIGHSGDRYLHPGRVSLGCTTVTDTTHWDAIYNYLINRRLDDKSVGKIEVKS